MTTKQYKKIKQDWKTILFEYGPPISDHIKPITNDSEKFECICCKEKKKPYYSGNIENLLKHLGTEKHKDALKDNELNNDLIEIIEAIKYGSLENKSGTETELEEFKIDEFPYEDVNALEKLQLDLAHFIVQNRIPFKIIKPFTLFLRDITKKYDIRTIQQCEMGRTTLTKIVTDCICGVLKEEILADLLLSPYSLAIDESTDAFGSSYLAICAKYLPRQKQSTPVTKLFSIIQLKKNKKAVELYKTLHEEIFSRSPYLLKNLMGLATDQGSNMIGIHSGLGALLKKDVPHLVPFNDLSHIFNLICKESLKKYPKSIMNIITTICAHFRKSSKRMSRLKKIQEDHGIKQPLEILKYVDSRWLSLTECLRRIIELWGPLKVYAGERKNSLKNYFSLKNELYFRTLLVILEKLSSYNLEFQKDNFFYNNVQEELQDGFRVFACMIMSKEKFSDMNISSLLNLSWDTNMTSLKEYLMEDQYFTEYWRSTYTEIGRIINELPENDIQDVIASTKNFVVAILNEMKNRAFVNDDAFKLCSQIFIQRGWVCDKDKWKTLSNTFKNIITLEKEEKFEFELEKFYVKASDIRDRYQDFSGTPLELWRQLKPRYPHLSELAMAILTLPHSSVPVERIFSKMKDFKTSKRNRLTVENLEACLLVEQRFTNNFEITEEMLIRRINLWKSHNQASNTIEERKDSIDIEESPSAAANQDMIQEEAPQPNNQQQNNVVAPTTGEKLSEEILRKDSFKSRSSSDYESEESQNYSPEAYQRSDTKSLKRKPKALLLLKGKKTVLLEQKSQEVESQTKEKKYKVQGVKAKRNSNK